MRTQAQMLQPLLERQRSAWEILNFFAWTQKHELAFWERFGDLPREGASFLQSFYQTRTAWELFERICFFWNVRLPARRSS